MILKNKIIINMQKVNTTKNSDILVYKNEIWW